MQRDDTEVHAHGPLVFELYHAGSQCVSHGDDIAAGDRRDTQAYAQFAVIAQDRGLWINVVSLDRGHVTQEYLLAAAAANNQFAKFFDLVESTSRFYGDEFAANSDASGIGDEILLQKLIDNTRR